MVCGVGVGVGEVRGVEEFVEVWEEVQEALGGLRS